ncbi:MAG: M28 family peptidase [Ignavibacteria bacterium]|nr:M28 family peptidase [Ignavibacteria bacterium]MCU7515917.1 M28 family peptidase [Ignavibacteria bacterium]
MRSLFLGFICFCLMYSISMAQIPGGYEKGLSTISKKEIYESISVLAADSMKGRPAGSRENLTAARYIAERFRQYGLKPLFKSTRKNINKNADNEDVSDLSASDDPSQDDLYLQKFVIKKFKLSDNNSLSISSNFANGSSKLSYKYLTDFLVQFPVPENLNTSAPIVFAGYGIDKGEKGYSDYLDKDGKSLDVRNKIVVVVDGFPQERDTLSLFSKSKNALYRNILRKADLAQEKGALAVIVIGSPFKNEPPMNIRCEKMLHNFQRETFCIPGLEKREIPIIYVSQKILNDLFEGSGKKAVEILENIDKSLKPESFEIKDKTLSLEIGFDEDMLKTQNVIGVIEGTDPVLKNEFVVIGAHYDHIGLGYYGTSDKNSIGKIHNGADDNASGVSGLLEIAEAFSKCPAKRSILFISFSGEENGMLGSKYYVNSQPLKPLDKTVAMLNLDMIGRNERNELWLGGAFYSTDIIKVAERANKEVSMNLLYNTGLYTLGSDQASFLRKGIPSLYFFSGIHEDYHMPTDDIEKIDVQKVENVSKLAYLTAWISGNEAVKAAFREVSMKERAEIVRESRIRQEKLKQNK